MIPRISTRGYYDLRTGATLRRGGYYAYPPGSMAALARSPEVAVMVHGLRNDRAGALAKAVIARGRLRRLGYRHPVAGFSYDSNVAGARAAATAARALAVGRVIARKNGRNLALFVSDLRSLGPGIRVRLLGHSLGSHVILSALGRLGRGEVESVHLFGASVPADSLSPSRGRAARRAVRGRIVN